MDHNENELQPAVVLSILAEKNKIAVFSLSKQMLITSKACNYV